MDSGIIDYDTMWKMQKLAHITGIATGMFYAYKKQLEALGIHGKRQTEVLYRAYIIRMFKEFDLEYNAKVINPLIHSLKWENVEETENGK